MKEKKTEKIYTPIEPSTKLELKELADQDDVSLAHVVRKALKLFLAAMRPHCPECKGTEIEQHGEFDKGLCRTVTTLHCADCGTSWEVD